MDKQSIIGQLELDINALQRQVEVFKTHPEDVTPMEWELFVKRLQLMYEYCRQLKMETQTEIKAEERKLQITVPVPHETTPPRVKLPEIVANKTSEEENPVQVNHIEMKEMPSVQNKETEKVSSFNTPAAEIKTTSQKLKRPSASIGGLFGDTHSLAEKFKEEPSLGDKIAKAKSEKSVADKLQHKPVKDLKDAIGINEKFLFINELFEGNLQEYSEAVNKLNASGDLQSAETFIRAELATRYNWTKDNQHVKSFCDLVERRFS